jgi:hypothetical protein
MKRYLHLLLVLTFCTAQLASAQHMAEHGFSEHKHNGHVCDIYLSCEQNPLATASGTKLLVPVSYAIIAALPYASEVLSQASSTSSNPRAPPAIFLL